MRRSRTFVVALVVVLVAAVPSARAGCDRVHSHEVPDRADLVPDSHARVLLPAGYCDGEARYPVVYLLHGVGDTWKSWTANTEIEELSASIPVIIVMPDAGRGTEAGWYSDWFDKSRDWERYHVETLVPWVDATFRTLPGREHRAVAGLSMGGLGAMSYVARHPSVFSAAASMSGFVDTMFGWPVNGFGYELGHRQLGSPDDRVWGDHIEHEEVWRAHNPTDLAAKLKGATVLVASGTGAPGGAAGENANPGLYLLERYLYEQGQRFVAALDAAGVKHTDRFTPGYHGWPYWEDAIGWALPKLVAAID